MLMLLLAAPLLAADDEKLERFLARLGLVELQIVQLEKSLESGAADAATQQRLAKRLADLYAEQLMNAADEPAAL